VISKLAVSRHRPTVSPNVLLIADYHPAAIAGHDNVTYQSNSQGSCDITSQGPSYNVALTNSVSKDLQPDSEDAAVWRNGTTPLITMFFNKEGDTHAGLVEPEVHLSCLRTVPSEKQTSSGTRSAATGLVWMTVSVMGFLTFVI
jgi:hypothetical protein